jgi:cell division protein FtsN
MKKFVVLGLGLCMALAFTSCKSSESAYKKAYEKAKQQELAESAVAEEAPAATPVVAAPVTTAPAAAAPVAVGTVREEKVQLVSGDGLKAYSVVCGSFGVKANADGLKSKLDAEGYSAKVVFNAERNMYRVVAASYDDRMQAAQARDDFKAKHPNNADFQKAWLLYNVK